MPFALYGSHPPAHLSCCSRQKLSRAVGYDHEGFYEEHAFLIVTKKNLKFNLAQSVV